MSIQITTEATNNDTILKFVSNAILVDGGSYEFNNVDEATNAPLVQQLFYFPFVKKVFISANFIAIQRYDIVTWETVKIEVAHKIEAHLKQGKPVIDDQQRESKKQATEVYAEATPNPSVMKFGTNKILSTVNLEFTNIEQANLSSPLATALFAFPFVKQVFIAQNYVSVTKYNVVEWDEVYAEVRAFIRKYLQQGGAIVKQLSEEKTPSSKKNKIENLSETATRIVDILEEHVKPAVASDGGDISFESYDEQNKIVSVILQGACSGCPSSTITLKNGIETMLKEMLPNQINQVVATNG